MQTRIDQMHNQRSPLFHQWLSAERVGACYGVANEDIAVVSQWLQSHGFKIDAVPAGKTVLIFSGTAGQVREAFHTEIHNLEVKGEKHIANMSTPQIPAALAPVIAGFRSLHNFFPKPTMHVAGLAKRNPKTGKSYLEPVGKQPSLGKLSVAKKQPGPDVTYVGSCEDGGTTNCEFLGPQDFYTIYNEKALLTGTSCDGAACNGAGQTIAVIEETDVCNGQASSTPNDCAGADDLTALIPNSAWVPSRSTIISESRQAAIAAIRAFRDRPELARKAKRISTCSGPARWLQARRLTSLPALRPGTRPAWVWPPRMR
jgi:subtilase family serine protease